MGIITGIDLIEIKEFERNLLLGKDNFKKKAYSSSELRQNKSTESLAGVLAAKEAVFKAMDKRPSWQEVEIRKKSSGKPHVESELFKSLQSWDISISHNGGYVVAIFTAITNDEK